VTVKNLKHNGSTKAISSLILWSSSSRWVRFRNILQCRQCRGSKPSKRKPNIIYQILSDSISYFDFHQGRSILTIFGPYPHRQKNVFSSTESWHVFGEDIFGMKRLQELLHHLELVLMAGAHLCLSPGPFIGCSQSHMSGSQDRGNSGAVKQPCAERNTHTYIYHIYYRI
jgi:hypothetical protein